MKEVEWLLDCTPRPVQIEAIRRSFYGEALWDDQSLTENYRQLRDRPAKGWGHFLEMRLGKTPTALNEFLLFEKHYGIKFAVVFSPNTYKQAWVKEIKSFGLTTPAMAFKTKKLKDMADWVRDHPEGFILVVNYEALIQEHVRDFLEGVFVDKRFGVFSDESIKIKNNTSIISRGVREFSSMASYTRALSGMPMTQGPHDLYPQLRFLREQNGVNFYAFRNRFCKMGGFKNKQIKGVKNEDQLQDILSRCSFTAKRKDWGKITVPQYEIEELPVSESQAKHYNELEHEFVTTLESGDEISVDQVITKIIKQQQISSGFVYNEEGRAIQIEKFKDLPKMARLCQLLEETTDKVIVCYNFTPSGDMLLGALKQYNPATIRSKQWMKKNDRDIEDEKKRFNEDPSCRVMLAQIEASKYGHYLAGVEGDRCTLMVFYENIFSLDSRAQVEMRNTSNEQDWTNLYVDFASTPVEKNVVKALSKKESIVKAVFGSFGYERYSE